MVKPFRFVYETPMIQAQKASRAETLFAFFERVLPLAQVDPAVLQALNIRGGLGKAAEWMDIPTEALIPPEEYAQVQQQQAAATEEAQQTAIAREQAQAFQSVARGVSSLQKDGQPLGGGGYLQQFLNGGM